MPKFRCKCGNVLDAGQIPMDEQYMFMSDVEMDHYTGMVDIEKLYLAMKMFMKCPSCQRLIFFWNGYGKDPEFFASEGIYKDFFRKT